MGGGNPDGRTWLTKSKQEKEEEIQKYFNEAKINILKNKIIRIEKYIKYCEGKIGQLIRPVLQEETLYTKNKAKQIKEKIKEIQAQIIPIKAKRKARKDRKEIKKIIQWLEFEGGLLTEEEMICILKKGVL